MHFSPSKLRGPHRNLCSSARVSCHFASRPSRALKLLPAARREEEEGGGGASREGGLVADDLSPDGSFSEDGSPGSLCVQTGSGERQRQRLNSD